MTELRELDNEFRWEDNVTKLNAANLNGMVEQILLNKSDIAALESSISNSSIAIDSDLSGSSTNPVENKVITERLSSKVDALGPTDTGLPRAYISGTEVNDKSRYLTSDKDEWDKSLVPTIPLRSTLGHISVPDEPISDDNAASKKYVDTTAEDIKTWAREYSRDIIKSPNFITNATYKENTDNNYSVMTALSSNAAQAFASAAFGEHNIIEGDKDDNGPTGSIDSFAAGARNRITGSGGKSALLGLGNISTNSCSFAANRYNTVKEVSAFALGERNQVTGSAAGALGKGLIAKNPNQVVTGTFNADSSDTLFVVGNGVNTRSNAMTILSDGTVTLGGHSEEVTLTEADIDTHSVYNFKSFDSTKEVKLYRISDTPCSYQNIREWLKGRQITIGSTIIEISDDMIIDETNTEDAKYMEWCDVRQNHVVVYNDKVILCVVDSIFHDSMDVTDLGIYVSEEVTALQSDTWVDHTILKPGKSLTVTALGCPNSKTTSNTSGYVGFGTCVVMHNSDTCLVFDLGNEAGTNIGETLTTYLNDNGIRRIDKLVISHFHSDHYALSRLRKMKDWFHRSNESYSTDIVVPHTSANSMLSKVTNSSNKLCDYVDRMEELVKEVESYKSQGFNVEIYNPLAEADYIEDLDKRYTLTFYNVASDVLDIEHISKDTVYNDMSMIVRVDFEGRSVLVTGDVEYKALSRNDHLFDGSKHYDIVMVPHHSYDKNMPSNLINKNIATYGIIPWAYDYENNHIVRSNTFAKSLLNSGCEVFTTYGGDNKQHNVSIRLSKDSVTVLDKGVKAGDLIPHSINTNSTQITEIDKRGMTEEQANNLRYDPSNPDYYEYWASDATYRFILGKTYDGEEYLTSEMFNGSPVYTKTIVYEMPVEVSGTMQIYHHFAHNISGLSGIVSVDINSQVCSDSAYYPIPYHTASTDFTLYKISNSQVILWSHNSSWNSGRQLYVKLKYTKD